MFKASIINTVDSLVGKVKDTVSQLGKSYVDVAGAKDLTVDEDRLETVVSGKVRELKVYNRVDALDDLKMTVKGLLSGLDLGGSLTKMDDESKVQLLSLVELYGYDGYNDAYLFGYDGLERNWESFKTALSKELVYFKRLIDWEDVDATSNLDELKQMVEILEAL